MSDDEAKLRSQEDCDIEAARWGSAHEVLFALVRGERRRIALLPPEIAEMAVRDHNFCLFFERCRTAYQASIDAPHGTVTRQEQAILDFHFLAQQVEESGQATRRLWDLIGQFRAIGKQP